MSETAIQSIQDLVEQDQYSTPERKIVKMGSTDVGDLFGEEIKLEGLKKIIAIPLYLERPIKVGTDNGVLHVAINRPPQEIDPDIYYPTKKMRVTHTRLDELDYAPIDAWKGFPLFNSDGSIVYLRGAAMIQMFFIQISVESLTEQEECQYVDIPPIKGSVILERMKAREMVGSIYSSATRRRVEEDEDTVEL